MAQLKKHLINFFFNRQTVFWIVLILCILPILQPSHAWFKKNPYTKEVKGHTRTDELYQRSDFYASISWTATLLDETFLQVITDEVGRIYDYRPAEKNSYYQDNLKRYEEGTVFFLSFYAYEKNVVDLTQKYPTWKIRLEVDGKRYDPIRVQKIGKPDVLTALLFPYVKPWANHYYLYFPKLNLGESHGVTLTVDGPNAHGKLVW